MKMTIGNTWKGGLVALACLMVFALAGCSSGKKAEESKEAEAPATPMSSPEHAGGTLPEGHPAMGGTPMPEEQITKAAHANIKAQKEIRLSDEVRAKWPEVKMEVTDTAADTHDVMTFKVGEVVPLKKEGYKIKVEAFVPDYAIVENRIETRSNEPKNPAVMVDLMEGDKSVARGWVFKDFPDFNSFNDPTFKLVLVSPGEEKK